MDLTDHACRHCHGRILSGLLGDGANVHRCAQCGAEVHGPIEDLCACGVRVGKVAVLECIRIPEDQRKPGWPEVGVRTRDADLAPPARMPRFVGGE